MLITKLCALVLLAIMVLGYLFFLSSHSTISHLYFITVAVALILTIVSEPKLLTSRAFVIAFALVAVMATGLSLWRIAQHLSVVEDNEYLAVAIEVGLMLTYLGSLLCSVYVHRSGTARAAA